VPDDGWTFDNGRVFVVSDIAKSVEHYCDRLGFTVTFQYGKPVFYACLSRDEVALHLLAAQETKRIPGNGGICVFVNDVDGVYAELAARGAKVIKPPQNYRRRDEVQTTMHLGQRRSGYGWSRVSSSIRAGRSVTACPPARAPHTPSRRGALVVGVGPGVRAGGLGPLVLGGEGLQPSG
jgi:catechol 2,3-dioxygenase-like lactoylglutathione lyase family enzyme